MAAGWPSSSSTICIFVFPEAQVGQIVEILDRIKGHGRPDAALGDC